MIQCFTFLSSLESLRLYALTLFILYANGFKPLWSNSYKGNGFYMHELSLTLRGHHSFESFTTDITTGTRKATHLSQEGYGAQ